MYIAYIHMQYLSAKHRFSVRRRQGQGAEVVVVAVARQQSSSNPRDWYKSLVGPGLDKRDSSGPETGVLAD